MMIVWRKILGVAVLVSMGLTASAQSLVMASTTSTEQSGLLAFLLPEFKKATGLEVRVVAVGTGQAIDMGRRGDADLLLVHDQAAEEKLVADGFVLKRYPVMYNDFVLVGPKSDPAATHGHDIVAALKNVGSGQHTFVSRGDKSGTHAAELRYWKLAELAAPAFAGYKSCGCGMGPALNMASALGAYVLTDRATWLAFQNRADLQILVEGDARLFNQYGVMVVNPAKFPHAQAAEAQKFVDWITSASGQTVIANYRINGKQLFFPNARP